MSKPHVHAARSAARYGGVLEDYLDIHEFMDSSKAMIADNRHRALTHNSWFVAVVLPRVFGVTRLNSEDKIYSVRSIGEDHVLEDYAMKFIPTPQDFLTEMEYKPWMQNGDGVPPSCAKLYGKGVARKYKIID